MLRRWRSQPIKEDDSSSQDAKVEELSAGLGTLSGRNAKVCTDACLRRYLEARNWNVEKAKKMLEETLKWRSIFKPEEIHELLNLFAPRLGSSQHEVAHEGETGKVSRANFHDRMGRPVLIMRPVITQPSILFSAGPQKTVAGEGNISHLVYLLENAILNLPEDQEQMSWLVDFTGWSINTNVPIKIARDIIYTLQNHYPERLAIIILYNPPRIFEAFHKIVKYFADQKTSQKIKFVYPNKKASVEIVKSFFDNENLPSEFGGNGTLKYDHEEFSKLMVQDDVKTAKFWGFDKEQSRGLNGHVGAEVAPKPASLAPPC
ncbi:hypothetical protein RJ639_007821 [Escallonia herrerae]|uniref:CRAL-TRIO domain-containing protein n=1 Tax=Escallonia herrerae TaxID=1293975 RepID=A0AA89AZL0_9ASTE|nr:hypothetical protein RJ639_007821 [Escallonia herrerae]